MYSHGQNRKPNRLFPKEVGYHKWSHMTSQAPDNATAHSGQVEGHGVWTNVACGPAQGWSHHHSRDGKAEASKPSHKRASPTPGVLKRGCKKGPWRRWGPQMGSKRTNRAYIRASLSMLCASLCLFLDAPIFHYEFIAAWLDIVKLHEKPRAS